MKRHIKVRAEFLPNEPERRNVKVTLLAKNFDGSFGNGYDPQNSDLRFFEKGGVRLYSFNTIAFVEIDLRFNSFRVGEGALWVHFPVCITTNTLPFRTSLKNWALIKEAIIAYNEWESTQ